MNISHKSHWQDKFKPAKLLAWERGEVALSPGEICEVCEQFEKARGPLVVFHEGWIDLRFRQNSEYAIELKRMNSPAKVLGWIHHLCGKDNVTTDHIEAFIDAAKKLGVKVDMHA